MPISESRDKVYQGSFDDQPKVNFSYNEDGQATLIILDRDTAEEKQILSRDVILVSFDHVKDDVASYNILCLQQVAEDLEKRKSVFRKATNLPLSFLARHLISSLPSHVSPTKSSNGEPNFHVIISVKSGSGEAEQCFTDTVKPALAALGTTAQDYLVHKTTSDQSIIEFSAATLLPRANAGVAQTVLLLSGDGGLMDILNQFLQSAQSPQYVKPIIGLMALGTGNALANSTGLNGDATMGLVPFLKGKPKGLPTFSSTFSTGSVMISDEGRHEGPLPLDRTGRGILYGAVVASWALHAALVADSDTAEYRKFGSERFSMAASELLNPSDGTESHQYRGNITLFKKEDSGKETRVAIDRKEHMYVLVALVSNLEKTFTVSPGSSPLDGQLRFLHFGALSPGEVMRVLGLAFAGGGHVSEEGIGYESIDGLRIDFDESDGRWRRVCIDGRIVKVGKDGWMEVRREGREVLQIVVDSGF
ncbi:hypothetical protein MMC09_000153 [Bachmanniomyces sp. S44760]|nr:hypothetical protein [Bachmanniomyces sp. S44760]